MLKGISSFIVLTFILLVVIILSGCVYQRIDPEKIAKSTDMVNKFLSEHPNATMNIFYLDNKTVEKVLPEIRKFCGEEFQFKSYWQIRFIDPTLDANITIYIDPDSGKAVCGIETKEGVISSEIFERLEKMVGHPHINVSATMTTNGNVILKIENYLGKRINIVSIYLNDKKAVGITPEIREIRGVKSSLLSLDHGEIGSSAMSSVATNMGKGNESEPYTLKVDIEYYSLDPNLLTNSTTILSGNRIFEPDLEGTEEVTILPEFNLNKAPPQYRAKNHVIEAYLQNHGKIEIDLSSIEAYIVVEWAKIVPKGTPDSVCNIVYGCPGTQRECEIKEEKEICEIPPKFVKGNIISGNEGILYPENYTLLKIENATEACGKDLMINMTFNNTQYAQHAHLYCYS